MWPVRGRNEPIILVQSEIGNFYSLNMSETLIIFYIISLARTTTSTGYV